METMTNGCGGSWPLLAERSTNPAGTPAAHPFAAAAAAGPTLVPRVKCHRLRLQSSNDAIKISNRLLLLFLLPLLASHVAKSQFMTRRRRGTFSERGKVDYTALRRILLGKRCSEVVWQIRRSRRKKEKKKKSPSPSRPPRTCPSGARWRTSQSGTGAQWRTRLPRRALRRHSRTQHAPLSSAPPVLGG